MVGLRSLYGIDAPPPCLRRARPLCTQTAHTVRARVPKPRKPVSHKPARAKRLARHTVTRDCGEQAARQQALRSPCVPAAPASTGPGGRPEHASRVKRPARKPAFCESRNVICIITSRDETRLSSGGPAHRGMMVVGRLCAVAPLRCPLREARCARWQSRRIPAAPPRGAWSTHPHIRDPRLQKVHRCMPARKISDTILLWADDAQ